MEGAINVKAVIVGDGAIGKTCVMTRYMESYFPSEYVPTIFDNKVKELNYKGRAINLNLWDTAGQQAYSRLRPIAYPNTDVFIIAFSAVESQTFVNAKKRWFPQVKREVASSKVLFVGTKSDLRNNILSQNQKQPILSATLIEKDVYQQFGCYYRQCSALTGEGIQQVFQEVVRLGLIGLGIERETKKSTRKGSSVQKSGQGPNEAQGGCYCTIF